MPSGVPSTSRLTANLPRCSQRTTGDKIIHGDGGAEAKEVATAADFETAGTEAAVRDAMQEKENASEETAAVETEEKTEKTPKKAVNKTD